MSLEFLIQLLVVGLLIGALARLALPGPTPMGLVTTMLCGIAGAFIGGIISAAIGAGGWLPFMIAVLCATAIVFVVSGGARRRRGLLGGRRGLLAGGRRGLF